MRKELTKFLLPYFTFEAFSVLRRARSTIAGSTVSTLLLCALPNSSSAEERLLDAVVASVDGEPITLHDLSALVARPLSVKEVSKDPEAKEVLDKLILERVLEEEAKQRGLGVTDEEIKAYTEEVARKNSMSDEAFLAALRETGKTQEEYSREVKLEILKSKVTAAALRGGVAVSDEEVERYLDEHEKELATGTTLTLSQIVLSSEKYDKKSAKKKFERIEDLLDDGKSFASLAKKYSEGPEAREGGLIGEVAEKDLHPSVFDAVFSLDEGEISDIVKSPEGFHIFYVSKRTDDEDDRRDSLKEQVREKLVQERMELKLATFLSEDLMKLHAVDRKI